MNAQPTLAGTIVFLPWVSLPRPINVGDLRFQPVSVSSLVEVIGDVKVAEQVKELLGSYRDRQGHPIPACTILLQPTLERPWHISNDLLGQVNIASAMLAIAALAEQRFYDHLAPHINATMFRPIIQGIEIGTDALALPIRRRGLWSRTAGLTYDRVVFQQPLQIDHTTCTDVSERLVLALENARSARSPVWSAIESSIDFFLLGHSEDQELNWHDCILLSVIGLEKLVQPKASNAHEFSKAFLDFWPSSKNRLIKESEHLKPDEKYPIQSEWPIRQKWAKDLYELRSSTVHQGSRSDRSENWSPEQHIVAVAFAYCLVVKQKLVNENRYTFSDMESGGLDAFDHLLDCGWESVGEYFFRWPEILSCYENSRDILSTIRRSLNGNPRKEK